MIKQADKKMKNVRMTNRECMIKIGKRIIESYKNFSLIDLYYITLYFFHRKIVKIATNFYKHSSKILHFVTIVKPHIQVCYCLCRLSWYYSQFIVYTWLNDDTSDFLLASFPWFAHTLECLAPALRVFTQMIEEYILSFFFTILFYVFTSTSLLQTQWHVNDIEFASQAIELRDRQCFNEDVNWLLSWENVQYKQFRHQNSTCTKCKSNFTCLV